MRTSVIVGNPRPGSRTSDAASRLVLGLTGRPADEVIELVDLGTALLNHEDGSVAAAVQTVQTSTLVVFASPTFKGSYTGLLKLFLEQFAGGSGLTDVVSVPLMLGASPHHSMAPEVFLRPLLTELGGTSALPGLYLIDQTYREDGVLDDYVRQWSDLVAVLAAKSPLRLPSA